MTQHYLVRRPSCARSRCRSSGTRLRLCAMTGKKRARKASMSALRRRADHDRTTQPLHPGVFIIRLHSGHLAKHVQMLALTFSPVHGFGSSSRELTEFTTCLWSFPPLKLGYPCNCLLFAHSRSWWRASTCSFPSKLSVWHHEFTRSRVTHEPRPHAPIASSHQPFKPCSFPMPSVSNHVKIYRSVDLGALSMYCGTQVSL